MQAVFGRHNNHAAVLVGAQHLRAHAELGVQMGVNPLPLFYAFEYGLDQYFFPYEGVMFLYIFTTGCVTLKHVIPTMIARCIVAGAFIAVIAIPYWTFIGIM